MTGWLLSACTDLAFRLANWPVTLADVAITRDVAYGDESRHKLDIYRPEKADGAPVIVFFYGGGWKSGDKADYAFVADAFTARGYVVVIPDYRTYPDVTFPAFVDDAAGAVAWTHRHIAAYGGDAQALFMLGHSAGAYNGAMLLADDAYLAAHGLSPAVVRGFAGLAGPYDFTPQSRTYRRIFNEREDYGPVHVSRYLDGDEPPMLLLHGERDHTVTPEHTRRLHRAIAAKGGQSRQRLYEAIGHYEIIGALTAYWRHKAPVLKDTHRFFTSLLP